MIRSMGPHAQVVALYLLSCPSANAIGLYYLPKVLISHDTGIHLEASSKPLLSPFEGVQKVLQGLFEAQFCAFDDDAEVVWVYEMARYQIGPFLNERDHRVKWVVSLLRSVQKNKFTRAFAEKYASAYHLNPADFHASPSKGASQGPQKPLGSQDQEQDQEQEQDKGKALPIGSACQDPGGPAGGEHDGAAPKLPPCPQQKIVDLYNTILPELPRVRIWNDANQETLRARWKEDPARQSLAWWEEFFKSIRSMDFLMGRKTDFRADLSWIVGPKNIAKIINGRYAGNGAGSGSATTDKNITVASDWAGGHKQ